MYGYVGATPELTRSIGHFEHQGMFTLALKRTLTTERMSTLCNALGIQGIGTIEQMSRDSSQFVSSCVSRGYYGDSTQNTNDYRTKIVIKRDATPLKKAAIICGYNDIVSLCNKWMGIDENDGIIIDTPTVAQKSRNYATVGDILADRNNFGKAIRDLTILLEDGDLWTSSAEALIDKGIEIYIDQKAISLNEMKGEFYLSSIKEVKLSDFLTNIESIGCESIATRIYDRLQELKANVIFKRKENFVGKNEVANWCKINEVSHLYDRLIELGFDSMDKLRCLDDQTCTELGIKGFDRISLMKKIKTMH